MLNTSQKPTPQQNHLLAALPADEQARVTEAAGKLQKLDVIEYHRGHINVIDRSQLEALCCECYAVVKAETDRLLPYPWPNPHPANAIAV